MTGIARFRKIFRPGVLAFFCLAAFLGWAINACCLKIGYLRLVCPAGFLEIVAIRRSVPWRLVPGFVFVAFAIFFAGRAWCGWFCQASFISEKMNGVAKGKVPALCPSRKPHTALLTPGAGDAAAIMAGLFAGMLVFGFPLLCIFCPVGIVSRNIISFASSWCLRFDLALLALPVLLALFLDMRRVPLCPAGLTRALLSAPEKGMMPRTNPELCIGCGRCREACPSGLNPGMHADAAACVMCLHCIEACPAGAISLRAHCGRCKKGH